MQTTSQNDSMSMDFFQIGGYKNIAGASASLLAGRGSGVDSSKKLSELVLLKGSPFSRVLFAKYGTAFRQAKEMTGLSTNQIDDLYRDFQLDGNRDVKKFPDYALEKSGNKNVFKEQIISDVEEMADVPELVIETPAESQGSNTMKYLYVALGVLAVVGVTVMVVKRR